MSADDDESTLKQRRIIDREIAKGLDDIKKGRVYGPFDSVAEMAASVEAHIKNRKSAKRLTRSRTNVARLLV